MAAFPLLSLPHEIVVTIVASVQDRKALRNLASTCKRLQDFVEPFVYRSILLEHGVDAESLHQAITRVPPRADYVHRLKVVPFENALEGIEAVPQLLTTSPKLCDLVLETPFIWHPMFSEAWNAHQSRCRVVFKDASLLSTMPVQHRPLQSLKSCRLCYLGVNSPRYPLRDHAVIFLHPTLTSLTISSADIDLADVAELLPHPKSTPLRSLHFDQCHFSAAGLQGVLSVPKALENLKIQEGYPYEDSTYSFGPTDLQAALRLHRKSLRSLLLGTTSNIGPHGERLDLTEFLMLRDLAFDVFSSLDLHEKPSTSPALETLSFSDLGCFQVPIVLRMLHDSLFNMDVPRLRQIMLRTRPGRTVDHANTREIEEISSKFKEKEVRLLIVRLTPMQNAVPPYLHREYIPEEIISYDSFAENPSWDLGNELIPYVPRDVVVEAVTHDGGLAVDFDDHAVHEPWPDEDVDLQFDLNVGT